MRVLLSLLFSLFLVSCDELAGLVETNPSAGGPPTKSEIAKGIREALIVGTQNTVAQTSQVNGFFNNPKIKIPFPPEAEKVASTARDLGLGNQVDQFVETMNHGAEKAAAKAKPIFVDAIKQMTLQDVYEIWRGENDAATQYLKANTMNELKQAFRPEIKSALEQVEVTKYWNPIVSAYNQIPLNKKVNPNLDEYVLEQTLEGMFIVIADEETKIRENPQARVSDILKRVFGYQPAP